MSCKFGEDWKPSRSLNRYSTFVIVIERFRQRQLRLAVRVASPNKVGELWSTTPTALRYLRNGGRDSDCSERPPDANAERNCGDETSNILSYSSCLSCWHDKPSHGLSKRSQRRAGRCARASWMQQLIWIAKWAWPTAHINQRSSSILSLWVSRIWKYQSDMCF